MAVNYCTLVEEAKQRGLDLLDDKYAWKLSNKSDEFVSIESKPSRQMNCNVWRSIAHVDVPGITPAYVDSTLALVPGSRRLEWDTDVREIKKLKDIDERTVLFYIHTNSVGKGVISPREFVEVTRKEIISDDEVLAYGCSVEHPQIPTDDKYVRALEGGWVLRCKRDKANPNRVNIESISEADMKGWIPSALLNATVPAVVQESLQKYQAFAKKDLGK